MVVVAATGRGRESTQKTAAAAAGCEGGGEGDGEGDGEGEQKKSAGTGVLQKNQKFRDEENPVFKNQGRQNRSFPLSKFHYAC